MVKCRVISFDGGGIRGLVTTILLHRIAATPGLERFLDSADDMVAWTKREWVGEYRNRSSIRPTDTLTFSRRCRHRTRPHQRSKPVE